MRSKFIKWFFNDFRLDELYLDMDMTSEESPWHRERTVGVHTDMVVSQYIARTPLVWSKVDLLGAFAAAFHDVGKPDAMQICYREDRGEYKRFAGHEQISARLWEDWAVRNWNILSGVFDFELMDIFRTGFIIEQHLPYGLKHRDKVINLMLTLLMYNIDEPFINHLMADTLGRISDDAREKLANTEEWISNFKNQLIGVSEHSALYATRQENQPMMYVPIAASGSGKSTLLRSLGSINVFSLDSMRLELYGEPYDNAFLQSTKDKHFRSQCNDRFRNTLRENKDVYLDNTNTSKKNRRFYITEARNRGYWIVAYLLPVDLQTAIGRQQTRDDKEVPEDAVRRQYMGIALPQIGEFDEIIVSANNL